jgi:hypothetical protein
MKFNFNDLNGAQEKLVYFLLKKLEFLGKRVFSNQP